MSLKNEPQLSMSEQNKLIDDLIKEDDQSTVKDFIELKQELIEIMLANK